MGSRSKEHKAYIAGFLDGDGSIMLQMKRRSDTSRGFRLMATICLYQDTRHELELLWMQKELGGGYVSKRNDGISELRINGFERVRKTLEDLLPHIRFKRIQARAMCDACTILEKKSITHLSEKEKRTIVFLMLRIQNANYASRAKKSEGELCKLIGLTP